MVPTAIPTTAYIRYYMISDQVVNLIKERVTWYIWIYTPVPVHTSVYTSLPTFNSTWKAGHVKLNLHEFGTCKIDFLYIQYYPAAKIDSTRKPLLAAPDLQIPCRRKGKWLTMVVMFVGSLILGENSNISYYSYHREHKGWEFFVHCCCWTFHLQINYFPNSSSFTPQKIHFWSKTR